MDQLHAIADRMTSWQTLDDLIDDTFDTMRNMGFEALIYDYTPLPCDLEGRLEIQP
mgnify:FL=1